MIVLIVVEIYLHANWIALLILLTKLKIVAHVAARTAQIDAVKIVVIVVLNVVLVAALVVLVIISFILLKI